MEYLGKYKKTKIAKDAGSNQVPQDKITINLRKEVKIEKGFVQLPKEVILEALSHHKIFLKQYADSGRNDFYYKCTAKDCSYRLKIVEYPNLLRSLNTVTLIEAYKKFDPSSKSEFEEGISELFEYNQHSHNHDDSIEPSKHHGK